MMIGCRNVFWEKPKLSKYFTLAHRMIMWSGVGLAYLSMLEAASLGIVPHESRLNLGLTS
jgi:hypothetical protein